MATTYMEGKVIEHDGRAPEPTAVPAVPEPESDVAAPTPPAADEIPLPATPKAKPAKPVKKGTR